jgi:hypothetical protein
LKQFKHVTDFERPPNASPKKIDFANHEMLRSLLLSEGEALSERERVEIFLSVVNAGGISGGDATRIGSGLASITGLKPTPDDDQVFEIPKPFLDHWRELLAAVVNEPSIINPIVCMDLALQLHGKILAVPAPGLSRNGFEMNYRIATTSVFAALDHANVLVLANFAKDLCQCHKPACGIFFLADPAPVGRTRREYCTDEHRDEFFKQTGADRVAASRAGETAERWREIKAQHPDMTPAKWNARRAKKHK